jgi:hypothetical protein
MMDTETKVRVFSAYKPTDLARELAGDVVEAVTDPKIDDYDEKIEAVFLAFSLILSEAKSRTDTSAPSKGSDHATRGGTEVSSDGRTIWVNDATGMCIGRFSRRGIDVHRSSDAQLRGESQCLDCIHDLPFDESWDRFVESMLKHHGVTISASLKPSSPSAPAKRLDDRTKEMK